MLEGLPPSCTQEEGELALCITKRLHNDIYRPTGSQLVVLIEITNVKLNNTEQDLLKLKVNYQKS